MALFALKDQQNAEEVLFTVLDLLRLLDGTETVNDEIIINNRIFRLSTFREIGTGGTDSNSGTAGKNGNAIAMIEEYPAIADGQLSIVPTLKPASKLSVHLNGLELHIRDDFTLTDDWTVVMAFPLISNSQHCDLIKLIHD